MDLKLTDIQQDIRDMAREFAEKEVAPLAEEIDREHRFPAETFAKMSEMGLTAITIPEEYGGAGLDDLCKALAIEEISKKCGATGSILSVHGVPTYIIDKFASAEQKAKWLPELAGGKLGAFALTEPGAGSDAGAVLTKAESDGDHYVINGAKCFITNGIGDYIIVLAKTDPSQGLKGISAIMVEKGTPGFSIARLADKMGICASATAELYFEDCRVPKANLIGKEGEGFKISMIGLDSGRIGMAAQALGIAEGAMEEAVRYSHERRQFGKPIGANQGIQWYFAEMATKIEAARGLIYMACYAKDNGLPLTKIAAMAKYYASEAGVFVTDKALQILGGYGYMKEYPVERMYRDARIVPIYEGTNEIQKTIIAREVWK